MPRERMPALVPDEVEAFFAGLRGRGHEPLLRNAVGTARFDVVEGKRVERWLVTIDSGEMDVSRRNAAADCVLRVDRAAFAQLAAGRLNVMAAALRAAVTVRGDPRLLVLLQRLFPRPSGRLPQSQPPGSDGSQG